MPLKDSLNRRPGMADGKAPVPASSAPASPSMLINPGREVYPSLVVGQSEGGRVNGDELTRRYALGPQAVCEEGHGGE